MSLSARILLALALHTFHAKVCNSTAIHDVAACMLHVISRLCCHVCAVTSCAALCCLRSPTSCSLPGAAARSSCSPRAANWMGWWQKKREPVDRPRQGHRSTRAWGAGLRTDHAGRRGNVECNVERTCSVQTAVRCPRGEVCRWGVQQRAPWQSVLPGRACSLQPVFLRAFPEWRSLSCVR